MAALLGSDVCRNLPPRGEHANEWAATAFAPLSCGSLKVLKQHLCCWKSAFFESLAAGGPCRIRVVLSPQMVEADAPDTLLAEYAKDWRLLDSICTTLLLAYNTFLELLQETQGTAVDIVVPVVRMPRLIFRHSHAEEWLEKRGLTHEELIFEDDMGEVLPLDSDSQEAILCDGAAISVTQVAGQPKTTAHSSWRGLQTTAAARVLLDRISSFIPAARGPQLFASGTALEEPAAMEALQLAKEVIVDTTGGQQKWLQADFSQTEEFDVIVAIHAICVKGFAS